MTGNLGMGVMIGMLWGDRGGELAKEAIGQKISSVVLSDKSLRIGFESGLEIELLDCGQSCCESRYMRSDDNPQDIVGHTLASIEIAPAPSIKSDSDCDDSHDVEFLRIVTDRGLLVISNHNEHNGYYGGFFLVARKVSND